MATLFNILAALSICLFYGMFAYKIATGKMVMRGFERIKVFVFLFATLYVYLSNVVSLSMFNFVNAFFWSVPFVWWLGVFVMYVSVALFYIDSFQLGKNFKIGVDTVSDSLTTTGFYAHSRNPMYVSFILFWFGAFLAFANMGMLLILLCEAVFYHIQVVYKEEPFLRQQYGEAFEDYCKKVRRWI